MPQRVVPRATPLGQPVDLAPSWNADNDAVASVLHPQYRAALARVPQGPSVFRGLPFDLGVGAGPRWILLDDPDRPVSIDLGPGVAAGASHLVVAHFSDSWREPGGGRPAGMPVGWVLPAGETLASYELAFADGTTTTLAVRRRFQIVDGIIGWGFLPFEAVGHRADATLDWRGPHPRQPPGRYAPAGHAGPLTMLPGAWGPDLTGVADFVPTPDDDITLWLHAIPIPAGRTPARLTLVSCGDRRPGTAVVVAGLTAFHGTANRLVPPPPGPVPADGGGEGGAGVDVDVGVVSGSLQQLPAVGSVGAVSAPGAPAPAAPIGWGSPRD